VRSAADTLLVPDRDKPKGPRWQSYWEIHIGNANSGEDFAVPGDLTPIQITALLRILLATSMTPRQVIDAFSRNWFEVEFAINNHGHGLRCGGDAMRTYAHWYEIPAVLN